MRSQPEPSLRQLRVFVVDSKNRKLIPNPEHGDKQMSEEYGNG